MTLDKEPLMFTFDHLAHMKIYKPPVFTIDLHLTRVENNSTFLIKRRPFPTLTEQLK